MSSGAVVHEWTKNRRELVRASLDDVGGRAVANFRVYALSRAGEWLPTYKGLAISADQLPELEEAVRRLRGVSGLHPA